MFPSVPDLRSGARDRRAPALRVAERTGAPVHAGGCSAPGPGAIGGWLAAAEVAADRTVAPLDRWRLAPPSGHLVGRPGPAAQHHGDSSRHAPGRHAPG